MPQPTAAPPDSFACMETNAWRALALTAVAPAAWGTTYLVTEMFLPPDRPLFAALVRALPAGLLLLAVRRSLPHGEPWSGVRGARGPQLRLFFPLIFLSAYRLPGGLAATVQATLPLAVMALAWPIDPRAARGGAGGRRPRRAQRRRPARAAFSGVRRPDRPDRRDRLRARRRARVGAGQEVAVLPGLSSVDVPMLDLVAWHSSGAVCCCCPWPWWSRALRPGSTPRPSPDSCGSVTSAPWWPARAGSTASACSRPGRSRWSDCSTRWWRPWLGIVFAGELFGWPSRRSAWPCGSPGCSAASCGSRRARVSRRPRRVGSQPILHLDLVRRLAGVGVDHAEPVETGGARSRRINVENRPPLTDAGHGEVAPLPRSGTCCTRRIAPSPGGVVAGQVDRLHRTDRGLGRTERDQLDRLRCAAGLALLARLAGLRLSPGA